MPHCCDSRSRICVLLVLTWLCVCVCVCVCVCCFCYCARVRVWACVCFCALRHCVIVIEYLYVVLFGSLVFFVDGVCLGVHVFYVLSLFRCAGCDAFVLCC